MKYSKKIKEVCKSLGIRPPKMKMNPDYWYSCYDLDTKTILLEPGDEEDDRVIVHELAHHYDYVKFGESKVEHGERFFNAMLDVTHAWYGASWIYDWQSERYPWLKGRWKRFGVR